MNEIFKKNKKKKTAVCPALLEEASDRVQVDGCEAAEVLMMQA